MECLRAAAPSLAPGGSYQLCSTSPPWIQPHVPAAPIATPCALLRQNGAGDQAWPVKGRASGGLLGAPDPMSSPSSAAPSLHVLFVPSSCQDRLHVASCSASPPAQSHHSDPPRLCLRSPFLHFYFYFSAKSSPSALCIPFCLPRGSQTSCHELLCCERSLPVWGDGSSGRRGRCSGCSAAPWGPWDATGVLGGGRVMVVNQASGAVSERLIASGRLPAARVLVCWRSRSLCSTGLLCY